MLHTYKIGPEDFSGCDVSSLPDKPSESGMTASELKAAFDRVSKEVIAPRLNGVIETLSGEGGADAVGMTDGRSVAAHLNEAVRSVNGKSGAAIELTAADIGAADTVVTEHSFTKYTGGTTANLHLRKSGNVVNFRGVLTNTSGYSANSMVMFGRLPDALIPDAMLYIPAIGRDMNNSLIPIEMSVSEYGEVLLYGDVKYQTVEFNAFWLVGEVSA